MLHFFTDDCIHKHIQTEYTYSTQHQDWLRARSASDTTMLLIAEPVVLRRLKRPADRCDAYDDVSVIDERFGNRIVLISKQTNKKKHLESNVLRTQRQLGRGRNLKRLCIIVVVRVVPRVRARRACKFLYFIIYTYVSLYRHIRVPIYVYTRMCVRL